jgi:hypothetical protein
MNKVIKIEKLTNQFPQLTSELEFARVGHIVTVIHSRSRKEKIERRVEYKKVNSKSLEITRRYEAS